MVQSEPGRGATFDVFLPATDAPRPSKRPSARPQAAQGPEPSTVVTKTVFVVEDDPAVRRLVVRTLRGQGHQVLEAGSGDAALARLDTEELGQVHLLITDIVMPGAGGEQVARRFLARYPSVPVLFMSGYADEILARRGVGELGVGFLSKPFSPAALRAAVEAALLGHREGESVVAAD